MQRYIGIKSVTARPLEDKGGYEVTYPDGYVSYCPKEQFELYNLPISGGNTITQADVDNFIASVTIQTLGNKTTIVHCILLNGYSMVESSSCVDPSNYNEAMGAEICLNKIKDKIWGLLGFLLQSATNGFDSLEPRRERPAYQVRVTKELTDLTTRTTNLNLYLTSQEYNQLSTNDRYLLADQYVAMKVLGDVLQQRVNNF